MASLDDPSLAKKYVGQDRFQDRRPGHERVKVVIRPERVRYVQQT